MKLTQAQVRHVAKLARLEVSDVEVEGLTTQLSAILDAVDVLAEVNTEHVKPMASVEFETQAPRADLVTAELSTERAFANAPQAVQGSFAIPKVIE